MKKFALIATILAICAGCASSGVQISEKAATQFKEGQTTEQQVIDALGKPSTILISGGKKTLAYTGVQYQIQGASFIPIVGLFAGGADVQVTSARYTFSNGILEQIAYSKSESNARTGQQPANQSKQEPRAVEK